MRRLELVIALCVLSPSLFGASFRGRTPHSTGLMRACEQQSAGKCIFNQENFMQHSTRSQRSLSGVRSGIGGDGVVRGEVLRLRGGDALVNPAHFKRLSKLDAKWREKNKGRPTCEKASV